jgi:hypothetical protein
VNDTLDFLLGSWRVERTVTDHRRGELGHFRGTATFTRSVDTNPPPDDGRVRFDEVGEFQVGNYRGKARRSLEYVARADSSVAINFIDGHHFIDLDLTRGVSSDEHLCNLDRYEITTTAPSPDLLEERWHVKGPEKDYDAITTFVRVESDSRSPTHAES